MRLECLNRIVGILEVAVHQREPVQLVQREQLCEGQAAGEVLVVLNVQVEQVLQPADGGRHRAGELVALQVQLAELCSTPGESTSQRVNTATTVIIKY